MIGSRANRSGFPPGLNSFNRWKCRTGNNDVNRFSEVAKGIRHGDELGKENPGYWGACNHGIGPAFGFSAGFSSGFGSGGFSFGSGF